MQITGKFLKAHCGWKEGQRASLSRYAAASLDDEGIFEIDESQRKLLFRDPAHDRIATMNKQAKATKAQTESKLATKGTNDGNTTERIDAKPGKAKAKRKE